jgi:hypothetical protein
VLVVKNDEHVLIQCTHDEASRLRAVLGGMAGKENSQTRDMFFALLHADVEVGPYLLHFDHHPPYLVRSE